MLLLLSRLQINEREFILNERLLFVSVCDNAKLSIEILCVYVYDYD
jgi:hypothetical protein